MQQTGERGEFFSPELSPFSYDETIAYEYYPLMKNEAIQQGYNWTTYEASTPKTGKTMSASLLPNTIDEVDDDTINYIIECEVSQKPYRITKAELEFYRTQKIPLPRKHPDIRHQSRILQRP